MNPDGVDYLDIGDAYLRGDWANAINAYWSPLYSWILGSTLRVLRPSLIWEFALVQGVNFLIYLLALTGFTFFWRELTTARDALHGAASNRDAMGLADAVWVILGYLIFAWTSLHLIEIWAVTPDMLVSALVFLAAGLTLRVAKSSNDRVWPSSIALGFVLGVGYLAKSAMFPLAFVFIAAAFMASGIRRRLPSLFLAVSAFLVIAAPFVIAISASKGRFTFGEAGRITYMKHVEKVPFPHWRHGSTKESTQPRHPTRRISDDPAVFEFAAPIAGTYPPSYDPPYWYEGLAVDIQWARQLEVGIASARYYADLFLKKQGPCFGIVLLLLLLTPASSFRSGSALALWAIVGISCAALGMYGLVLVHGRYIGPFVAILWGAALAFVRLEPSPFAVHSLRLAGRALVVFALLGIAAFNFDGLGRVLGWDDNPWRIAPAPREATARALGPVEFAQELREVGLYPGDHIAYIGDGHDAFFARLARLKIIAEIPADQSDAFWDARPARRDSILATLARTGAVAVVAERAPPHAATQDWQRIGDSRHFLFRFAPRSSP